MKTVLQKQVYSTIRNILVLTFISGCSGFIHGAFFNCSNYTFHENSTEGRSWETSRLLCQNSSEGDLVSIEEEEERNFVKNIIKKLPAIKYFIGLKKDDGKWKWLTNRTTVDESKGNSSWALGDFSWALGEPSGTSIRGRKVNCATIYGNYRRDLGRFDDMSCRRRTKNAGHICEKAVSCTKHERGTRLKKKPTDVTRVHSTAIKSSHVRQPSAHDTAEIESTASNPEATKERGRATSVHSTTRTRWKTQSLPSTAEIDSITPDRHATKEGQGATSVHSITRTRWKTQPFPSTAAIDSISPVTKHLERADESSNLIAIIVSVLASFVILGTAAALLLFLVYRSRKKAEQEMDDYESLPEVKRQDACVTIEQGDGGSFLSKKESSTKRPKESLIEEESSTNSYSDPLHISATTKTSKVVVKKDTPVQHQVYAQIHSKQAKAAFHLDHVMQDLGEKPSQVMVDEENCKPSAAISSAGLEKELTRDEDAVVKQNASAQNQCIDCVYAIVDKTMKKLPPAKPAPYQELVYADLSHSPKKSKDGIHQEMTGSIYADIDHVESSAMRDSGSQQENEVELTECQGDISTTVSSLL
ncbi:PREDICTED: uncharacterized protein LOC107339810 isoform X5 [Acropora digitifera]|uniref:uncharacterized protein LOC107339810 isoform X5 n=1 Tax=Acropora digitifera TaxID=70779 RepID=UPI00077A1924|nr:PREDICTED: uncharacterized protein LOC107339810 isoform X5 [Acropora digitifera]